MELETAYLLGLSFWSKDEAEMCISSLKQSVRNVAVGNLRAECREHIKVLPKHDSLPQSPE